LGTEKENWLSKMANRESLVLFSPAKVNLFFRVLRKREDGYHEIASLYQAISLGDTLTASLAEDDRITCDDPGIPCDERNLLSKALRVFREKTGLTVKIHFHLEKKIPIEAGCGGGSSNAATALFALNVLTGSALDEGTLCEWASTFSSDAPFFFSTGSAYARGRGEQLTNISALGPHVFWLAKPKVGLSTPLVYKTCNAKSLLQRDPQLFLEKALQGQLELFNDLEHPAFSLMPSLSDLKQDLLRLGFSQVSMTGSGTAFMCFGNVEKPALPGISFFSVRFVQRKAGQWYTQPI
jgi:4-diphosphocytidyl-2-C-methyl-D-erythritol kinase